MHALRVSLVSALLFALTPSLPQLGPGVGALLLVALGVGLARAVSGEWQALPIGCGALGGLAWGIVGTLSAAAGGALVVAAAYLGRTLLVEGRARRAAHVGLGLLGGALGAPVAMAHRTGEVEIQLAAAILAATFVALPLFVAADDPTARRLEALARALPAAVGTRLVAAAGLRRRARSLRVDRATRRQLERLWRAMLGLAETRLSMERTAHHPLAGQEAVLSALDHGLQVHATLLEESHLAIDRVRVTTLGLDDRALQAARATRDALIHEHAALLEVVADLDGSSATLAESPATLRDLDRVTRKM